jgi:hypothetical protein
MGYVMILNENLYRKEELALRRYFKRAHKYLIFKAIPKLKEKGKIDGIYEVELPSSELFNKCYGKLILKFSVKNDIAVIENIEPEEILVRCYEKDLPIYKGVPYDSKKDLFKLKTLEGICQKK